MTTPSPLEVAQQAYAAFGSGDLAALGALLSPDTHWQVGDVRPLNGDYHGPDEVFGGFLGPLMELTGGSLRLEVHDVMASDKHAAALVHETGERDGRTLDGWVTHVMQVTDGKITRFWASTSDPDHLAFWAE